MTSLKTVEIVTNFKIIQISIVVMNEANLDSFTDILGDADEVANSQESQPLSISSENSVDIQSNECKASTPHSNAVQKITRPAKGTGQYGQFRSIQEIEEKYRDVFSYPFFNLVQSSVIEDALYSDKSMVVCAPTGSGKTVVFEMAIVQLLMELEDKQCTDDFKIIYMAPVKALCTERLTEWYPKFTKHGLMCIEVTGDTDVDFSQLKPYRIIITTPEKWDMVTRRWREHRQLVEVIKLFLIDEVHILNDDTRGPVLEAVVSRMKTIEASAQSAHRIEQLQRQYQPDAQTPLPAPSKQDMNPPKIRFVAVSATVGNPGDVAAWLGNTEKPAVYYKFGDESRPVKLKRVVEGYPCPEGTSIFKFDVILNYKLWPVIQKYHNGKPTLIFCNTRKSVALTAETLSREITINFNPEQQAKLTALASTIKNKKLQMLVLRGVGCHHAGLLYEERTNIETAFRNRDLPILITTTTLAMGVNLPAHLVIIKNTQQYVNGAYQEYGISTVLQMVGRAGRPQFDTEATAVIMTRLQDKPRYQALVGGSEPLQSYLHKRLPENLNSEAALGTVNDVAQCVQWLRSTFLCVRAARDPKRYLGLPQAAPQQLISKKIEELCVKAMNGLATAGLITMDEASCIESTEAGRLMSIFYLDLETMKHIMKINGTETLERLLWVICESHELADMHLRVDERRTLNALNRNNASATIRFPMKGKISTRQMKLNCIIQAVLGCLNIPDPSLNQEAMKIMRVADRVCKCLLAYVTRPALISTQPLYYYAVLNGLILAKCISAHLWENSPYVSRQLRGIGPTFSTLLATAGKVTFMLLEESHPRDLERIMNKGAPAGNVLRKQISLLPKYQVTITPVDEKSVTVQLVLLNQNHLLENMEHLTAGDTHKSYVVVGDSGNNLLLFMPFKDKDLLSVFDGVITHQITRKLNFEHKIFAHCISSTFVGIDAQCEYTFKDLEAAYPSPHLAMNMNEDFVIRKANTKQTMITDTFKERKRKSTSENSVSQSKEKKKREDALLKKFKCLKESFGKTSRELKEDLEKTAMTSNEIVKDLGPIEKPVTKEKVLEQRCEDVHIQANYKPKQMQDTTAELIDDDDLLDDEKINRILNEIDDEISRGNYHSELPEVDLNYKNSAQNISTGVIKPKNIESNVSSAFFVAETNERNYSTSTQLCSSKNAGLKNKAFKPLYKTQRHIPKNTKAKLNFVGMLRKNESLNEENDKAINNLSTNTGFSETIKAHIEKYLQQTKALSNIPDKSIIDLVDNTNEIKKNYAESNSLPVLKTMTVADNNTNKSQANINSHLNTNIEENINLHENIERCIEDEIENHTQDTLDKINTNENTLHENKNVPIEIMNNTSENCLLGKSNKTNEINENMTQDKTFYNPSTQHDINNVLTNTKATDNSKDICKEQVYIENAIENSMPRTKYMQTELIVHNNDFDSPCQSMNLNPVHYVNSNTINKQICLKQITNNLDTVVPFNKALNTTYDKLNDDIYTKNIALVQHLDENITKSPKVIRSFLPATSISMKTSPNATAMFSKPSEFQTQAICPSYSIEKAIPNFIPSQHDRISSKLSPISITPNYLGSTARRSKTEVYDRAENKEYSHSDRPQNDENTNIRNYAYSATKIDVTDGEGDTTVIRKIKMDLNITEIIARRREMTRKTDTKALSIEYNNDNKSADITKLCANQAVLPFTSTYLRRITNISNQAHNKIPKIDSSPVISRIKRSQQPAIAFCEASNEISVVPSKESYAKSQEIKCFESKMVHREVPSSDKNVITTITTNSQTICNMVSPKVEQTEENDACITTNDSNNYCYHLSNIKPQSPQKEVKKIENILQKYSKILRKDKSENLSQKSSQSKAKENALNTMQPEKPKRPFKISDIQNFKTPLPKIMISSSNHENSGNNNKDVKIKLNHSLQINPMINKNLKLSYNRNPEEKTAIRAEEAIRAQNFQAQNLVEIQKIADNIEEDLSNLNPNDTIMEELVSIESVNNFDIDNSMFNPKTMLQCYNNEDPDAFVPPPPEFCDDENEFQPQEDVAEDPVPIDCYEPTSWENIQDDYTLENSIFQNDSQIELTPRKELETWTFSEHDESYQNISPSAGFNSQQSFTTMHTPRLHNRPFQNVSVSRQNRLGQFKFCRKKRLPKP